MIVKSSSTFQPLNLTPDPYFRRIFTISLAGNIIFFTALFTYKLLHKPRKTSRPHFFTMVNASKPRRLPARSRAKPPPRAQEKKAVAQKVQPKKVIHKKADVREKPDKKPAPPAVARKSSPSQSQLVSDQEMAVENPAFKYPYFQKAIVREIGRNWHPPRELLMDDEEKEVIVVFTILKNGNITDISLEESSWNNILDRMALRAVELAKLPPLPAGFAQDRVKVKYHFKLVRE